MQANALIFALEGLFASGAAQGGFFSRATAAEAQTRQSAITWLYLMKCLLRSRGLRDGTDWEIVATSDAVNADAVLDSTGGTIYGIFVDSIFDVAGEDLVVFVGDSGGSATLDATGVDIGAISENEGLAMVKVSVAAGETTPQFGMWIDPQGQVCANDIHAMADGEEGTAPTANDVRVWVIYRSDTEVRQV